ncbi:YrzI family small protein [Anaerobacillus isosaccharinicus]|uniref:YrzI family small protein n=1 Tax=Anaerobacillus isosaccharinicus TaxID=1532552 RepID=A0A7S7L428_9BACI|nr:YrzI family small protein [Anaerobacillus isosaccharinicus]MBA5587794.1 YrzI family small protein [Anaerobacillus isosaccharinicus]QOY34049.1 YrzI family small protein [Anaerobacillus isosaccharinicus]
MLLNLFFITVKISKRQFTNEEIKKAYHMEKIESHLQSVKAKQFDHQQIKFL